MLPAHNVVSHRADWCGKYVAVFLHDDRIAVKNIFLNMISYLSGLEMKRFCDAFYRPAFFDLQKIVYQFMVGSKKGFFQHSRKYIIPSSPALRGLKLNPSFPRE